MELLDIQLPNNDDCCLVNGQSPAGTGPGCEQVQPAVHVAPVERAIASPSGDAVAAALSLESSSNFTYALAGGHRRARAGLPGNDIGELARPAARARVLE